MRRRRRTGAWLPPDPYEAINTEADTPIAIANAPIIKGFYLNASNNYGSSSNKEVALVGDKNEDIIAGQGVNYIQNGTLADNKAGYSLKRIVGKIFVSIEQSNIADDAANLFLCTAGIIVRRVDDTGTSLAQLQGAAFTDTYESATDPWIWRRNWILRNALGPTPPGFVAHPWPENNLQVPGVLDGPHVDAKTRRTVKSEERLFLDITVTALNGGSNPQPTTTSFGVYLDLHFFGRVFTSSGNRRNASR